MLRYGGSGRLPSDDDRLESEVLRMNYQDKTDKSPAQTTTEQTKRNFSQLSQLFLKSKQFFFKAGITVKPEDLSSIYCRQ